MRDNIKIEDIEKNKIWIKNEKIISIRLGNISSQDSISELLEEAKEILKKFPDKDRVLIDLGVFSFSPNVSSSLFRKQVVGELRGIKREAGSKKIAVFGGNVMKRTITSFVISASGIKNMKVFKTEREALNWLEKTRS